MSIRYFIFGNMRMGGAYDFLAGVSSIRDAMDLSEDFVLDGMSSGVHIARSCPDGELEIIMELGKAEILSPDKVDPACLEQYITEFNAYYRGWAWFSSDSQRFSFPSGGFLAAIK